MSAEGKAVITYKNNNIIGNGNIGLNFVFLSNIYSNNFYVYHDPSDILQYNDMINMKILHDGYLIVSARGDPFRNLAGDFSEFMKNIGSNIDNYSANSRYILISQFKNNRIITHFESISKDTITYPIIYTKNIGCYHNPTSLKPYKHNIFFSNKDNDMIKSCSLEAVSRGYYKFGIIDRECIPIKSDRDLDRDLLKGSECVNGKGDLYYMSVYNVNKYNMEEKVEGVVLFESEKFSGKKLLLTEGEHTNPFGGVDNKIDNFRSVIIGDNYIFFGVTEDGFIKSFSGPKRMHINNRMEIINVMRKKSSSVILSSNEGEYVVDIGRTQLPPYMYVKVNRVLLGSSVKRIILYSGFDFTNVIENRTFSGRISYPKIIRSVEIK